MNKQVAFIQRHSNSSYIIAVPDDFSLTKVPKLEDRINTISEKLTLSSEEFSLSQLSETLDYYKSESDIWIKDMHISHWIIFALLQEFGLIIHEFATTPSYSRIFNILARGKQQQIEKIISGQYL